MVASRKIDRLKENPPKIDLFFARPEEIEIDPNQEWLMVEERTGFYEAQRHTMTALHKMMKEPLFPFSEHLIDVEKNVSAPGYIVKQPLYNMGEVFQRSLTHNVESMNALDEWPKDAATELDDSQQSALKRILTKRLAIIQGPPGTGKTFVSVTALKILLSAMKPTDPPIVVACQTNHALDQLLRTYCSSRASICSSWRPLKGYRSDQASDTFQFAARQEVQEVQGSRWTARASSAHSQAA